MQTPGRGWWCDEHQRPECVIPRSRGRGTCHGSLVADTDRCRMHLGTKAQPVIAEAKLREQAAAELARLDVPPVNDPLAALAQLAGEAVAWKNAMAGKVNALTGIRYQDTKGSEQLRAELALWERALDRCVSTLTAMARLDIDGRLVGVREKTADMLVAALETALAASGLDFDAQWEVRDVFRKSIVLVRPLSENPEVTQAELVDGEIRSLEAQVKGREYFPEPGPLGRSPICAVIQIPAAPHRMPHAVGGPWPADTRPRGTDLARQAARFRRAALAACHCPGR